MDRDDIDGLGTACGTIMPTQGHVDRYPIDLHVHLGEAVPRHPKIKAAVDHTAG